MPWIRKTLSSFFICALLLALAGPAWGEPSLPKVERLVLENRLTVLVASQHHLPFVTFRLLVDAGSWRDPDTHAGLANLTAEGILLGTAEDSLIAINRRLDFLGAGLSAACRRDFATISFRVLKKDLEAGFAIFRQVVMQPAFPPEQLARKIEKLQGGIRAQQDQPQIVADKAFHRALFRAYPYGHPVEGTIDSLSRMDRQDVVRFYEAHYRPNNAVLAIVGDVSLEEVKEKLLPGLRRWPAAAIPERTYEGVFEEAPEPVQIDKPISQANIVMGHAGIARTSEDYYAVTVMNQVLGGGGFSSRLLREIRVKRGLAYSVVSYFAARRFPGSFQIVLQTQNRTAGEAIRLARAEMEKMQAAPPTETEMETAKNYLIGSFPMRFDSQGELAEYLVQIEYHDLGLDYFTRYPDHIRAVSREDAFRAAKAYLFPQKAIVSMVADLEKAEWKPQASRFIPLSSPRGRGPGKAGSGPPG